MGKIYESEVQIGKIGDHPTQTQMFRGELAEIIKKIRAFSGETDAEIVHVFEAGKCWIEPTFNVGRDEYGLLQAVQVVKHDVPIIGGRYILGPVWYFGAVEYTNTPAKRKMFRSYAKDCIEV